MAGSASVTVASPKEAEALGRREDRQADDDHDLVGEGYKGRKPDAERGIDPDPQNRQQGDKAGGDGQGCFAEHLLAVIVRESAGTGKTGYPPTEKASGRGRRRRHRLRLPGLGYKREGCFAYPQSALCSRRSAASASSTAGGRWAAPRHPRRGRHPPKAGLLSRGPPRPTEQAR